MKKIFTLDNFKQGGVFLILITFLVATIFMLIEKIGMWVVGGFIVVIVPLCFIVGYIINKKEVSDN